MLETTSVINILAGPFRAGARRRRCDAQNAKPRSGNIAASIYRQRRVRLDAGQVKCAIKVSSTTLSSLALAQIAVNAGSNGAAIAEAARLIFRRMHYAMMRESAH